MERSLHSRYLNSQDQLIITLNEQIESMAPLKDSYATLQRYHIKLSHDFQTLLADHDHISNAYISKIQQLLAINQQLDTKKNRYIDQLRNLENQKAKLTLERKNLMSSCETLSSKFNLQSEQGIQLQQRTRQIIQGIKRTEQNIATYRKIISQIQCQIRLKSAENIEIENQILRRIQLNRKNTQKIQNAQSQTKTIGMKNEKILQQIRDLDRTHDTIELKIRQELKRTKQLSGQNLVKKEQLANLYHQKQYYSKLIQSESLIKEDLDISETKLNGILERKIKECERLGKQNNELATKISNQQDNLQKSTKYKSALTAHLCQLMKANSVLIQTMKKSCKQDEKAHLILNKKLQGLDIALIRSADIESGQSLKKTFALRERTNDFANLKKAQKSGSTWINQLTDIQNRC